MIRQITGCGRSSCEIAFLEFKILTQRAEKIRRTQTVMLSLRGLKFFSAFSALSFCFF
jgi:hypothetical protein